MPAQDKSLYPRIYKVVRQVPRGRVASYGQIAEIVGVGATWINRGTLPSR